MKFPGQRGVVGLLCGAMLAGLPLFASDVTGTWKGKFLIRLPSGETREALACLILKQNGSEVSGSAGPSEERQLKISKGTIEGGRVLLEQNHANGRVLKFKLTLSGDAIQGEMTYDDERPGGRAVSRLELKRKTP